jgi:hypothetical protein
MFIRGVEGAAPYRWFFSNPPTNPNLKIIGGALNPHLAFGELVKLLSAPFGRCILSTISLLAA